MGDSEPAGSSDAVAASRSLEQRAERLLAAGRLDAATAQQLTSAVQQVVADRTNGEDPRAAISRLRDLLAGTETAND